MHCTVLIHFDAMDTEYWIGFSINFCSKTICSAFKWHLCAEAKPHNKNNLSIRCYAEIGNKCGFFLCCSRRFRIYSIDKISPSALRLCNTHKTYLVGNEFVFRMFIVQLWKQCVLRERFEVLKWYVPWHHGTVFTVGFTQYEHGFIGIQSIANTKLFSTDYILLFGILCKTISLLLLHRSCITEVYSIFGVWEMPISKWCYYILLSLITHHHQLAGSNDYLLWQLHFYQ